MQGIGIVKIVFKSVFLCIGLQYSLKLGMWSPSRRLGLETVSRSTNVSSRSRSNMSRFQPSSSHLGSRAIAICISLRRFVQARAVHTVAAVILTSVTFVA